MCADGSKDLVTIVGNNWLAVGWLVRLRNAQCPHRLPSLPAPGRLTHWPQHYVLENVGGAKTPWHFLGLVGFGFSAADATECGD